MYTHTRMHACTHTHVHTPTVQTQGIIQHNSTRPLRDSVIGNMSCAGLEPITLFQTCGLTQDCSATHLFTYMYMYNVVQIKAQPDASVPHTLILPLTHLHTHTLSFSHFHTPSHSLTFPLPLTHTLSHTHIHSLTHSLPHSHTHTPSSHNPHTPSPTLTHTLPPTLTHTPSLSQPTHCWVEET